MRSPQRGELCLGIIKLEDVGVGNALFTHHGSTDLAETDTVPPPTTVEDKTIGSFLHFKSGRIKMRFAQPLPDLQFFADLHLTFLSNDLKQGNASRGTSLKRDEVEDAAEVDARLSNDQLAEFVSGETDGPSVEVLRLLVVVVQNLAEHSAVGGVAIKVWLCHQIGMGNRLPTGFEAFGHAATAFGETGVANLTVVGEHLSASGIYEIGRAHV